MRTIIIGSVLFLIWIILSTVCFLSTRGFMGKEAQLAEAPVVEVLPEAVEPEPEPEPRVESPGSFTVHHDFDRSEINPDPQLDTYFDQLVAYLGQQKNSKITVVGFTDSTGPEDYNYRLGLRRASSVRDHLVGQGVSGQIISTSSQGESAPAATNASAEGRAQNRRTEIQISN